MGKQINYHMGFKDFIKVAQFALDLGCVTCREEKQKIICNDITDFSTDDYGQTEWKRKEYISPELLELKMRKGYKLSL